ncbi:MAG: hypothetical protein ACRYF2_16455 [Janthinobacterium lividum]
MLDVTINGRRIGQIGEFQSRNGALFATRHELTELGLQPGPGPPDEVIAVASLPGVSERLDQPNQAVAITAATPSLRPALLGPSAPERSDVPLESGVGAVLNYNLVGAYAGGRSRVDTLLDGRVFSP